jgi:site-specific DNA recombinase
MKNTAIYIRKSSESDDRQVLSLEAQLSWATEICERLGILQPRVFEDRQSAKTTGRPAFARMMILINAGRIETVLCWKADRLARNAPDGGTILCALEAQRRVRLAALSYHPAAERAKSAPRTS